MSLGGEGLEGVGVDPPTAAAQRLGTPALRSAARHYVSGYQMREHVLELGSQTPLPKLIPVGYLLVMGSFIAFGAARELLWSRQDRPREQ